MAFLTVIHKTLLLSGKCFICRIHSQYSVKCDAREDKWGVQQGERHFQPQRVERVPTAGGWDNYRRNKIRSKVYTQYKAILEECLAISDWPCFYSVFTKLCKGRACGDIVWHSLKYQMTSIPLTQRFSSWSESILSLLYLLLPGSWSQPCLTSTALAPTSQQHLLIPAEPFISNCGGKIWS